MQSGRPRGAILKFRGIRVDAVATLFSRSNQLGRAFLLLGSAGISLAAATSGTLPMPWFGPQSASNVAQIAAILVGIIAIWSIIRPSAAAWTMSTLGLCWAIAAVTSGLMLLNDLGNVSHAVALFEAMVLACAAFAISGQARARGIELLGWIAAAMLALFGSVHLRFPEIISGLIPDLVPLRPVWPLITGPIMIGAGIALPFDRARSIGAGLIALMFLSWIPIVHLPRILANPSSNEFIFGSTALALAGCLMFIAGTPLRTEKQDQ